MPDLADLPIDLGLYETVLRGGGALRDIKTRIGETWQRSIRSVGGYWLGTAEYRAPRDELLELFLEGMMREVRETLGGLVTWQGFIAEMHLTQEVPRRTANSSPGGRPATPPTTPPKNSASWS